MSIYLKYFKYVMEHKINVFKVCYKKRRYWKGLIWHGILHDLSKFSPSEFKAYAENFYGDRDCRKCKSYMKCDYNQIGLGAGKWAKECADYRYKGFKDALVSFGHRPIIGLLLVFAITGILKIHLILFQIQLV